PVVVAVDDAQWLDPPSATVLEFALRRLESEPVGVLASARGSADARAPLELDRSPLTVERIDVKPPSLGALHGLLSTRLPPDLSQPTVALLQAAAGDAAAATADLDRAVQAGLVEIGGDRVRFSHPLLAAAAYAAEPPGARPDLHRRLAEILDDPEERARHLALAAREPDSQVAAALEEAASAAAARGAPEAAAERAEHAAPPTPPADR